MTPITWIIEPWHGTGFVVHDGGIGIWRKYLFPKGKTAPVAAFYDTREEVDEVIAEYEGLTPLPKAGA